MRRRETPMLIGVVHLLPLPGSPAPSPGLDAVRARAVADAEALLAGGADGLIVENLGDAPFTAGQVAPYTVAAMTAIAGDIRRAVPNGLLGINVLRNDALSAISIAAAVAADFVRVNVHVGAMVTDQGVITGTARETLLERRRLGADIGIAADVLVKHAVPLGDQNLQQNARDTHKRGGADALIVTGSGTGRPIDLPQLASVREAVPDAVIWAGSGVTPLTLDGVRPYVDAVIVGTWLHEDADLARPVSVQRVRELAERL